MKTITVTVMVTDEEVTTLVTAILLRKELLPPVGSHLQRPDRREAVACVDTRRPTGTECVSSDISIR